jgi:hypothetical protein
LSKNIFVKNLSNFFVKKLSIICSFAQIVRRRRKRRRRLVAPRPGGDFVAHGKKCHQLNYLKKIYAYIFFK